MQIFVNMLLLDTVVLNGGLGGEYTAQSGSKLNEIYPRLQNQMLWKIYKNQQSLFL